MTSYRLGELAAQLGGEVLPQEAASLSLSGLAELSGAGVGEIAPLTDLARLDEALASLATAFLVRRWVPTLDRPQLICADPRRALAQLLQIFHPVLSDDDLRRRPVGVDPRAAVADDVVVENGAWIGPFTYIGPAVRIEARARIEPFSYLGPGVKVRRGAIVGPGAVIQAGADIGERSVIGPGVVVGAGCQLAEEVKLGSGAVVGGEGFGFWTDESGEYQRLPSPGSVSLGPRVEIGANSCVDRAVLGQTCIARGTKIDNLVQVGHNVQIGRRVILCAQVGLAGSVKVGDGCIMGGQVGVGDHLQIGAGTKVGGGSGVTQSVPPGAEVSGYPALPHRRWLRSVALFGRLKDLARQIQNLRREVALLSGRLGDDKDEGPC